MKYLFSLLMFMVHFAGYSQTQQYETPDSVKIFLDRSLIILQQNAINKDSINWELLKNHVYQKAAGAVNYQDIANIFPYIFEQIGDHHGALKYNGKSYYWRENRNVYHNQVVLDAVNKYPSVYVKKLGKNVGYILLPGNNDFSGKNINQDAQKIRDAINAIDPKKIKGWILDLRINTGGSMYQMLAGLGTLLGDGKVGSFVNQHQQLDGTWIIKNGNIYLDSNHVSSIANNNLIKRNDIPIAVLISGQTASSGEIVAISTVGRKNTIRIGENSAGYTTANEGFKINQYAGLNLSVDFDVDRTGKVYKNYINPEIFIADGDDFENLLQDLKVKAGMR